MYGLKPVPFKTGPLLLNGERPGVEAGSFLIQFHYVKYTKSKVTQMHSSRIFDLVWMVRHGRLLHRVRGLTRFLAAFGGSGSWMPERQRRVRDAAVFFPFFN